MKKYLIILMMFLVTAFISVDSKVCADTDATKSSSKVGITFVDTQNDKLDPNLDQGEETQAKGQDKLPSTGSKVQDSLILLGIISILLAIFMSQRKNNKEY